ncbi:sensor histidine kinase [Staphylococcus lugdunensis]|uniref:sensor histidine kinase n=1 Tax=Staphylococcus lugdunensis TaxID=28035 RepID=UPI000A11858D|nr:HAMP domain-containing sensor histidine kinase [Staphylococcus lugdunensis]ARJ26207.1 two-component sensor histidine kinase [Staphylococcus lugdunensis]MCH8673588.1 HAMP domain-containing histidine kinase [Staphylococcus lugdunensis]MCH8675318.1 HAMP domain-containing histidine kinase [Staphylococcus lugdunensis]MCI2752494.1 HAMP domain-containing histidine kinase [Staphylococcus lugdunensis]MCI2762444.1 HAMP domain-containing histidine kinase [Staphylococcus lugdunensis]
MTIRKQLIISFFTSITFSTLFLFVLNELMWFDMAQTLLLTLFSLISSMVTMMIAMTFSIPTIHKIEKLNHETQKVANGSFEIEPLDIQSPLELKELNDSFETMVTKVREQMERIKSEETEKIHMVQNLAHDLKTPLATIKSYSEALKDGVINTEERQQHAYKVLISQSDRLSHMFDDLTTMITVSGHSQDLGYLQIDQLLLPILEAYQQQIEQQHRELIVDVEKGIPRFLQDGMAIERILSNFLDNALKFSKLETPIVVTAKKVDTTHVSIAVTDQGCGIAEHHLKRIFERTYRIEHSRNLKSGGSGLGLYIAQMLAHQIDGHITVDSKLNEGTTMTLTFNTHKSKLS